MRSAGMMELSRRVGVCQRRQSCCDRGEEEDGFDELR